MSDITLHKLNEAFIKFECEKGLAQELSAYFEFYVPGYQFTPAYKSRMWDGKIRLYNIHTQELYCGLLDYVRSFAVDQTRHNG